MTRAWVCSSCKTAILGRESLFCIFLTNFKDILDEKWKIVYDLVVNSVWAVCRMSERRTAYGLYTKMRKEEKPND